MATNYPMKRFPDLVDGKKGVFSPEAKEYGVGAFSWIDNDGDGLLYIVFRHPNKVWRNTSGEMIGIGSIPVNDGRWNWDGNRDVPTLNPSILFKTSVPDHMKEEVRHLTDNDGWTETFHGFIKKGVLEVL